MLVIGCRLGTLLWELPGVNSSAQHIGVKQIHCKTCGGKNTFYLSLI